MTDPVIAQTRDTFSLVCGVRLTIAASADRIWRLLTDAADFPRWNSTVTSIEGRIAEGQRLRLQVPDTKRVFTPTVSGVVLNAHMVWSGGFAPMFKGVRTFDLTARAVGSTDFAMEERFTGLLLPLIGSSMPDFGPIFTTFADDLRREAELTVP